MRERALTWAQSAISTTSRPTTVGTLMPFSRHRPNRVTNKWFLLTTGTAAEVCSTRHRSPAGYSCFLANQHFSIVHFWVMRESENFGQVRSQAMVQAARHVGEFQRSAGWTQGPTCGDQYLGQQVHPKLAQGRQVLQRTYHQECGRSTGAQSPLAWHCQISAGAASDEKPINSKLCPEVSPTLLL